MDLMNQWCCHCEINKIKSKQHNEYFGGSDFIVLSFIVVMLKHWRIFARTFIAVQLGTFKMLEVSVL